MVLVPGLVLPLHIFEQRYRDLVTDLLAVPEEEREFVIVAIRDGREVGADGVRALHDVGVIATVREITPHDDGRFDLVTVGATRVRMGELSTERSYLTASVSTLPEESGEEAELLAPQVKLAFATYRALVTGADPSTEDLPDDPGVLSYLVAAALVVNLPDRQAFLEMPTDATRLRAQLARIRHEVALLRTLPSLPATDLHTTPPSWN
jgi:Lon protease-like protein